MKGVSEGRKEIGYRDAPGFLNGFIAVFVQKNLSERRNGFEVLEIQSKLELAASSLLGKRSTFLINQSVCKLFIKLNGC